MNSTPECSTRQRRRPRGRIFLAWQGSADGDGWCHACIDLATACALLRNTPDGQIFVADPARAGDWRDYLAGGDPPGQNCTAWPERLVPWLAATVSLSRTRAREAVDRYIREGTGVGADLWTAR